MYTAPYSLVSSLNIGFCIIRESITNRKKIMEGNLGMWCMTSTQYFCPAFRAKEAVLIEMEPAVTAKTSFLRNPLLVF